MRPDKEECADQFTLPEIAQLQRYGQALGGGITPFDEEVERALEKLHPGETGGSTGSRHN